MADTSVPGIGSGLDVEGIVSQLMKVERRPLELLAAQAQKTQSRLSAFAQLKSLLSTFQGAMRGLDAERFSAATASVGDATLASATAGANAVPGRHSLEVLGLAEAQKLKSEPFASAADGVGTGTLVFEYGSTSGGTFANDASRPAQSVVIGAGQDTLAGVRDAINAAGIGVSASLIDDGGGPRLVLASRETGTRSTLRISVSDGDGTNGDAAGLSRLAYDPAGAAGAGRNLVQTAAAADATFRLDGIAITRGANTVSDALDGVTLSLLRAAPGTATTLTVARDTLAAQTAVQGFVKAWNDVRNTLATLTAYDPQKKTAGTLQGDSLALAAEARLRQALGGTPAGLPGPLTTLSQAGVTLQKDGTLALDTAKLQAALARSPESFASLFGAVGRASDARVSVLATSAATRVGSHAVVVTQAAARGELAGSDPPALTVTAGVNDALTLVVDGIAASVTLAPGTYADAAALGANLQSRLNGATALAQAGAGVDVAVSGGRLVLTSRRYGSASTVGGAAGTAAAGLFGAAPVSGAGRDVEGSIAGVAASGSGRTLVAAAGSAAEGLRLRIEAAAPGALGEVAFSRGYADLLAREADAFAASGGAISARVDGLNAALRLNNRRQDEAGDRLAAVEARLRAQFTALDALVARMNQTGAFLTQQLANLPKIG